jgi:hypothetical protein
MRVFDLQGTLANTASNQVLYTPIGEFAIVSAESPVAATRNAVRQFVDSNFPNCSDLRFVSGSRRQVIDAKVQQLRNLSATEYTDNDLQLLAEYQVRLPSLAFYYIKDGKQSQL